MNKYSQHLRRMNCSKDKHDNNETASKSTSTRHFKEMEVQVKRMTRKNAVKKQSSTNSISFVNLLSKNISRMRKNNEAHSKAILMMEFKPVLTSKALLEN